MIIKESSYEPKHETPVHFLNEGRGCYEPQKPRSSLPGISWFPLPTEYRGFSHPEGIPGRLDLAKLLRQQLLLDTA